MKILESSPNRYDKGIRMLTLGKIDKKYDRMSKYISQDDFILDIGCGTGMLSFRALSRGAKVLGIDINPEMLEIARTKAKSIGNNDKLEFKEMGVAELDSFEDRTFDKVMSGLCLSELSENEITYTLKHVHRILKEDGILIIGDEYKSNNIVKRIINFIVRLPLIIITFLFTQTTTSALYKIEDKLQLSHFEIINTNKNKLENFIEIIAKSKEESNK